MKFKHLRAAFLSIALLATGTAHAADTWCGSGKTVHFAGITWESGAFATEVLRQILEKGYGCKTDEVPGSTAAPAVVSPSHSPLSRRSVQTRS